MSWRAGLRRFLLYSIVATSGFVIAYMLVAFVVFPAAIVPNTKKVPNVVGLDYDDAARRLDVAGFRAVVGESRPNTKVPRNAVVEQNPVAGTDAKPGTSIALNVSAGVREYVVPNVLGRARQLAEIDIASAGLQVGAVSERDSDAPRGQVIETSPRPGDTVAAAAKVDLVVSNGPAYVDVPDVSGQSVAAARAVLEQLGLKAGDVVTDSTAMGAPGTVIGQSPAAGTRVPAGSSVTLRRAPPGIP